MKKKQDASEEIITEAFESEMQAGQTDPDLTAAELAESDLVDSRIAEAAPEKAGRYAELTDGAVAHRLTGMYKEWFLDYASYVILERAVPHLHDGLKPVQRRILHAMKRMDDGRYNKVANVIGSTMQFHPHGDASIGDALVQLGQKELLIDTQGNWGNILTGDSSAAPRYIEARLSKLATDVVFNPKTTEWMASYDGRNQEPVTLPVKFPLLLSQGVEGIAVGLASKILPHNFIELLEASVAHLREETFTLYPDFPTGGMIDVSKYNDGIRGGAVKVRARIVKQDKKTLVINEIPFGKNTSSLIDSILKANEKGKIKIKKVDDNTSANVEIVVHLSGDVSPDKTIDALYAFTDCEVSISPNACVIEDKKPLFIGVSEMLRRSVGHTKGLLQQELEIRLTELGEEWHMSSLERIFIENRIYHDIEEVTTWEGVLATIDKGLKPFKENLRRAVTREDIVKLTEIKIKRISKFDSLKADELIKGIEAEMERVQKNLDSLVKYTIAYYQNILKKHGVGRERKTEIRSFDTIEAAKVVVANAKLYVNRIEGFYGIGAAMRKDGEYVCDCSDIDDVILFNKQGKYTITKVSEKAFFSKNILYIGVFKKNDDRAIYNVLYRDGLKGAIMMKRCAIKGITRDREYDLTKGTAGSEVLYMSVNPNGEAETLKVYFKPRPRLKKLIVDLNFGELVIKGRQSLGNLFSRYAIHKIVLKERGSSTLGGQNVWFDHDILRLNTEERGELLGEFSGEDRLVVFAKDAKYYTTGFDQGQHFPDNMLFVEKFTSEKVYSVIYLDAEQGLHYLKRFQAEQSDQKSQAFVEDENEFVTLNDDKYPVVKLEYGGKYNGRSPEVIDAEAFIGIKSHRAKGKRLSNLTLKEVSWLESLNKDPLLAGPEPELEEVSEQLEEFSDEETSEETTAVPEKRKPGRPAKRTTATAGSAESVPVAQPKKPKKDEDQEAPVVGDDGQLELF